MAYTISQEYTWMMISWIEESDDRRKEKIKLLQPSRNNKKCKYVYQILYIFIEQGRYSMVWS